MKFRNMNWSIEILRKFEAPPLPQILMHHTLLPPLSPPYLMIGSLGGQSRDEKVSLSTETELSFIFSNNKM